jgi:hypothetical protein
MAPQEYLSLSQAAAELGLTRERVRQFTADGRLATVTIAGRKAVRRRDLVRFAAIPRGDGRPKKNPPKSRIAS